MVSAAAAIFLARPGARENRFLAAFLLTSGLAQFFGTGVRFLTTDRDVAFGLWVVRIAGHTLSMAFLLLFYGTLGGPVARLLRSAPARVAAAVLPGATAATIVARPDLLVGRFALSPVTGTWVGGDGVWWMVFTTISAGVFVLGIPVTLAAMREAVSDLERRKARAVAIAFGVLGTLQGFTVFLAGLPSAWLAIANVAFLAIPFAQLVFLGLLASGILRAQVLDVDLRLKWTVRHGTVAAVFVAVFFVVSEGAQVLLADNVGPFVGVLAAGALVFALAPLQRAAERVAAAAVPGATADPAYRDERRREIYRAAVESAGRDGVVTDRERDVLATLQEQLAIGATEALAIEREVLAVPVAGAGASAR